MSGKADIIVENARLAGHAEALAKIAISDGIILEVGQCLGIGAHLTVDAKGNLVTPAYVNPHLHLCKVWTRPMMSEAAIEAYHGDGMAGAAKAIDHAAAVKANYDSSWIIPNARRAVVSAALHGNL